MNYKDYYQLLGVAKTASEKDIKRAYRDLARKYHPDKNPGDNAAEEKFKEINEAYEVLGSPEKRTKYDQLGANYHRFQQGGGNPGNFDYSQWVAQGAGAGGYRMNVEDLFGSNAGFSDFFTSIFGGRGAQAQPVTGRNIEHTVDISLEEAYHGTVRALVRDDGERFNAKIPRGAKTGTRIRLRGKGSPGAAGSGDLYLNVNVKSHPILTREDDNLGLELPVDLLTAVLGGKVRVNTLAGPVNLTIRPGTQGGQTIRLKGKGMPRLKANEKHGDLLVTVQIQVPDELTDAERALYEQLAQLKAPTE